MQSQPKNQRITITFVGAPNSGKSCIVTGYKDTYTPTLAIDYSKHTFLISQTPIQFSMWDISGSTTFNDKNLQYIKKGEIVACVYALNDKQSFMDCQELAQRLLKQNLMRYDAKVVLVGTKCDLIAEVTYWEGIQAAAILKGSPESQVESYFEVSTKTDPQAVRKLCQGLYKVHKDPTYKTVTQLTQLYSQQKPAPPQQPIKPPVYLSQSSSNSGPSHAVDPPEFTRLYKIVLLGYEGCGKSAIVSQFARFQMIGEYVPTIGVDFAIRILDIMGERVKMQIWDTAGIKKFQVISNCYIKGCQAAIIVFDVTNPQSYKQLPEYMQQITKHASNPQKTLKYIIANKIDKFNERQISREQAEHFAHMNGYQYMEVSALQRINIDQIFYNVGDGLLKVNGGEGGEGGGAK